MVPILIYIVFYVVRSCACIAATSDNRQPPMFRFPCIGRYSPVPTLLHNAHDRHHSRPLPCVFLSLRPLSHIRQRWPSFSPYRPSSGPWSRPSSLLHGTGPRTPAAGGAGAQSDSSSAQCSSLWGDSARQSPPQVTAPSRAGPRSAVLRRRPYARDRHVRLAGWRGRRR